MASPPDPSERCLYCHNLQPFPSAPRPLLSYSAWIHGITNTPCSTCPIVHQALQKLFPGFLRGASLTQNHGPRPDTNIWFRVEGLNRIVINGITNGIGRPEVDLQLFYEVVEGEERVREIPHIHFAHEIAWIPGHEKMWDFLRKCLNDCLNGHEKCREAQDPKWFPPRLLVVTKDESGNDLVYLIQTADCPPTSPYIALSHCWGESPPFCATTRNLTTLLQKISFQDLPRTFQDCIFTAWRLGVKYIWIDSLCIIQDDREDWAHHAQSMDRIYENALFTVAAVSSSNGNVPFLGTSAPSNREIWQAVPIDVEPSNIQSLKNDSTSPRAQVKARKHEFALLPSLFFGPLENRGWAWQERYLSIRIMNFTQEEARWHCKTIRRCECFEVVETPSYTPEPHWLPSPSVAEQGEMKLRRKWRTIVTAYSPRSLTYASDRLPALSGAASRFQHSLNSTYLAGIWASDFPYSLAWYIRESFNSPTEKPEIAYALDNGVPSWSWASVSGEANWMWHFNARDPLLPPDGADILLDTHAELISTRCNPSTDNVFGEVEEGAFVRLRGRVVEAEIESDGFGCACVERKGLGKQHVVPDCMLTSTPKTSSPNPTVARATHTDTLEMNDKRTKGPITCLLLFTTLQYGKRYACILILGKGPNANHEDGTYQRLGIGNSDCRWSRPHYEHQKKWEVWEGWEELGEWEEWEKWFEDSVVRTVTIV